MFDGRGQQFPMMLSSTGRFSERYATIVLRQLSRASINSCSGGRTFRETCVSPSATKTLNLPLGSPTKVRIRASSFPASVIACSKERRGTAFRRKTSNCLAILSHSDSVDVVGFELMPERAAGPVGARGGPPASVCRSVSASAAGEELLHFASGGAAVRFSRMTTVLLLVLCC